MGRWVTQTMLDDIQKLTHLTFTLVPVANGELMASEPIGLGSKIDLSMLKTRLNDQTVDITLPIAGLDRRHIADLTLSVPRASAAHIAETRQFAGILLITLMVAMGVGMFLLIERLIIRRLRQIEQDIEVILTDQTWSGHVEIKGKDEVGQLATFMNRMLDVIRQKVEELRIISVTDTLTNLPNRRQFDQSLERMFREFKRSGKTFALVIFDVDNFKRYNDIYGHPAGDDVLIKVAGALRTAATRPADLAARLGGEEFALLLPQTGAEGAMACAMEAREAVRALGIVHSGNDSQGIVTVSAGIALISKEDSLTTLYARADEALYLAKKTGRDKVCVRAFTN